MPRIEFGLAALLLLSPARPAAPPAVAVQAPPRIEVLFALDTTGSMGGHLEGAKLKIWSIANGMLPARPTPRPRVGLMGYRDRGDVYVTRFTDLSEDMDAVYARLRSFEADGGGDAPESVNQALHEAVTRPSWSQDPRILRIIFLVGDAPPHMDYQDDVKYPVSCRLARRRDILINTIQCGEMGETVAFWRDIAAQGGGTYAATGQTGDMKMIATPMDAELARLNGEVGRTLLPYGAPAKREATRLKQSAAECMAPGAAADRLAFNAATGRVVQGGGDLLDDLRRGETRIEGLGAEELPQEMKGLSPQQRKDFLQKKEAERRGIQARIEDLSRRRQDYLEAERRRHTAPEDAFDVRVAEAIRAQARRKGILMGPAGK